MVVFSVDEPYVGYLNFVQLPADLDVAEATELALTAVQDDIAQEGWTYAGGVSTVEPGVPARFIVHLTPGEYQIAASYSDIVAGVDDVMRLSPLTVTAASDGTAIVGPITAERPPSDGTLIVPPPPAQPPGSDATASILLAPTAPPATITLTATDDLRYVISPDPAPSGPQVWEIANTGEVHSHHVVMARVPDGTEAEDISAAIEDLNAGIPPAPDSVFARLEFVGHAALQSGGQTTWVELALEPGTYAVVCFIVNPQTERSHALDGMVTNFTVD